MSDVIEKLPTAAAVVLLLICLILVVLWTILPWYVMRMSDRLKRMEACLAQQLTEQRAATTELRTQTGLLRALVAALQGAEVDRK